MAEASSPQGAAAGWIRITIRDRDEVLFADLPGGQANLEPRKVQRVARCGRANTHLGQCVSW